MLYEQTRPDSNMQLLSDVVQEPDRGRDERVNQDDDVDSAVRFRSAIILAILLAADQRFSLKDVR